MIQKLKRPLYLKFFLLKYLPMAFMAGLKIRQFEDDTAVVGVPYNWITKNPFKSMYFAVQSMAAEFSTAILIVQKIESSEADIALFIVSLQADFLKRAQSDASFICEGGTLIEEVVQKVKDSDSAETLRLKSIGKDMNGEVISEFQITWSLKKREKNKRSK